MILGSLSQVTGHPFRAGDQRPDVRAAQDQPAESGGRGGGRLRDLPLAGHHQGQEDQVSIIEIVFAYFNTLEPKVILYYIHIIIGGNRFC